MTKMLISIVKNLFGDNPVSVSPEGGIFDWPDWPASLTRRWRSTMGERKRLFLQILIMTTVSMVVVGITIGVLYKTAFRE